MQRSPTLADDLTLAAVLAFQLLFELAYLGLALMIASIPLGGAIFPARVMVKTDLSRGALQSCCLDRECWCCGRELVHCGT